MLLDTPQVIEPATAPEWELAIATNDLVAAIDGYWQAVLTYESTVGLTPAEARQALHHSALALRALEAPIGVAS